MKKLCKTSLVAYNSALSACEKGSQWETALLLLFQLDEVLLQPDVVTCSAAISSCESSRHWEMALILFTSFREQTSPDVIIYGSIIAACEKGKAWQEAFLLFQYMLEDALRPDIIICNALISSCYMSARWSVAMRALQTLQDLLLQASVAWRHSQIMFFFVRQIASLMLHDQHVDGVGGWGCHRIAETNLLY